MRSQVLGPPACYVDRIHVGLTFTANLAAIGEDTLTIRGPRHRSPRVVLAFFVGQLVNLPGLPIQQRDVVNRRILGLVSKRDGLAVIGLESALFAYIRSVCQVYRLAPFAGCCEQVP